MLRNISTAFAFSMLALDPASQAHALTEAQFWKKQMKGWGGIAARCEGTEGTLTDNICQDVSSHAAFLTASAKVPFVYTGMSSTYEHYVSVYKSKIRHPVELKIRVRYVTDDFSTSVYAEIVASASYSDAVESGEAQSSPRSTPRSGDLVLYTNDIIGQGTKGQMLQAVSKGLKRHVEQFLTLYVKYNSPGG